MTYIEEECAATKGAPRGYAEPRLVGSGTSEALYARQARAGTIHGPCGRTNPTMIAKGAGAAGGGAGGGGCGRKQPPQSASWSMVHALHHGSHTSASVDGAERGDGGGLRRAECCCRRLNATT